MSYHALVLVRLVECVATLLDHFLALVNQLNENRLGFGIRQEWVLSIMSVIVADKVTKMSR